MTNHYFPDQEVTPVARVDVPVLDWTPRPSITKPARQDVSSSGRMYSLIECNGMPDHDYSGHSARYGPLSDL